MDMLGQAEVHPYEKVYSAFEKYACFLVSAGSGCSLSSLTLLFVGMLAIVMLHLVLVNCSSFLLYNIVLQRYSFSVILIFVDFCSSTLQTLKMSECVFDSRSVFVLFVLVETGMNTLQSV